MVQTNINNTNVVALAGGLKGEGHRIDSYLNNSVQTDQIAIDAADLATTVTINGTAITVNVGAASLTKEELRDLLVAAINANTTVNPYVVASDNADTDKLYVEIRINGTAYTIVDTTNTTLLNLILNDVSIPFGLLVVQDTTIAGNDRKVHLPKLTTEISTSGIALGISKHTHLSSQNENSLNNLGYKPTDAVNVVKSRLIYVESETALAINANPFWRFEATVANPQRGKVRNDADTAKAVQLPAGTCRVVEAITAAGLVLLSIDLI